MADHIVVATSTNYTCMDKDFLVHFSYIATYCDRCVCLSHYAHVQVVFDLIFSHSIKFRSYNHLIDDACRPKKTSCGHTFTIAIHADND